MTGQQGLYRRHISELDIIMSTTIGEHGVISYRLVLALGQVGRQHHAGSIYGGRHLHSMVTGT